MHKLTFPIDVSEKFNKDILEEPGTEPQLADVMLNLWSFITCHCVDRLILSWGVFPLFGVSSFPKYLL